MIIGISGKKGSGKDAFGGHLIDEGIIHNKECESFSFAGPIKQMVMTGFNLTYDQIYGAKKEEVIPYLGVTPRYLMQTLGTEWGRNLIQPNIWVDTLFEYVDGVVDDVDFATITDVRFLNEIESVKKRNGILVKVQRDEVDNNGDSHLSETELDYFADWDYIIDNNGTLADLQNSASTLLREIGIIAK